MPFAELLSNLSNLRAERTFHEPVVFPDWVVGETYEGHITFILRSMDEGGSRFEVKEFQAEGNPRTLEDLKLGKGGDKDQVSMALSAMPRPSPS